MCSVFPNSDKDNIYRKLVAANIPRRSHRSSSTHHNIPAPRIAWSSSKNTNSSVRLSNKHSYIPRNHNSIAVIKEEPVREVEFHRDNNKSKIGLEIKINSFNHYNVPHADTGSYRAGPEIIKQDSSWTKPPQSEYPSTEVYDDDMISVWSSFDLKSYDLDCRRNSARAKSAPPRRLPYHCGNATLLYSESRGSSQCSRRTGSHDKLKQVLAETTPKLVKSVHLDYDLFLQALKLEKCVPAGVSDKRIRKDIARVFKKHNAAKLQNGTK